MTGEPPPLGLGTLSRLPASARPLVDPADLEVGVLHLGLGVFHRAHQVVYTEEAMAVTGDRRWGICAAGMRSRATVDAVAAQDGLFSVLVRDGDPAGAPVTVELRVYGALRETRFGAEVIERVADPRIKVVTITVTEKGYLPGQDTIAWLVAGLERRSATGGGPLTVLSCDNMPHNGQVVRDAVLASAGHLRDWIDANVAFPSSMVDRLVPTPRPEDLAEVAAALGVSDRAAVATEPFRQWVIEDRFAAERPAWEKAGALIVPDVAPYELMKLRLLNGSHSLIAYLGMLHGCETIAETVARDDVAQAVRALMDQDITPTLPVPEGFDVEAYKRQLLQRFANPALRHQTAKVAADGSLKLPLRLVTVMRERLAAGATPSYAALGIAAWMRWVSVAPTLDDPIAPALTSAAATARYPGGLVAALLPLIATDLPPAAAELVTEQLATLW
ncbi:mannitol dehydrogenase family protein [Thermopolyspora sp. NPDC052614]|uniref:mannitol dehydrogenase family protein n=1 Tax=Thermopolyspora sp. NPDC052614 TaxID=3155682 RepID=UPI0034358BDC